MRASGPTCALCLFLASDIGRRRVKAHCRIALLKQADPFQAAVLLVEHLFAPVFGNHRRPRRQNLRSRPAQQSQRDRILLGRVIGRIEKHYSVAFWFWIFSWFWTRLDGGTEIRA